MRFDVITIFPEVLKAYFNSSILARAQKSGKIKINVINLRDFTDDKHHKVDDKPYGGGPGMIFKIEPLVRALGSILKTNPKSQIPISKQIPNSNSKSQKLKTLIILLSAAGKQFDSKMARDYAKNYDRIVMIAGHYEGIDERIKFIIHDSGFIIREVSIGPYVLTGGEVPAMVLVDAVSRHIPGVLGKDESLEEKRFGIGVPAYTRPEIFQYSLGSTRGKKSKKYSVPKVLLSGDHKKIEEWREKHQK